MKKAFAWLALSLIATAVHANDAEVDFRFFDSAKEKGEKFVAALPKQSVVSRLVLKGKPIDFGGEWRVLRSDYMVDQVMESGGPTSTRDSVTGYLILERSQADADPEFMQLEIALDGRVMYEYLNINPTYCVPSSNYVFQRVDESRKERMACLATSKQVVPQPGTEASERKLFGLRASVYKGKVFPVGSAFYEQELMEARNASYVYAYRVRMVKDGALEDMNQRGLKLRDSVRENFF
ncbi:hypothetical protein [Vogesella sp. LIG4]|uniref:hypothetical protein n=1 Tax=Vogesella sp. LIG4 TaxID=1192162 RepID=UPI000820131E|nr:hypothetical protein [Vogesella sp. LIG4]SCK06658.1 hypothetical protein PSELUDRAFT_0278 [Vogesella sp. LIG4]